MLAAPHVLKTLFHNFYVFTNATVNTNCEETTRKNKQNIQNDALEDPGFIPLESKLKDKLK